MLEIVKARILSVVSNDALDAYLLSESSMFVYPNRLILKTCGTTTLLHAVPKVLEIAQKYCGWTKVDALFYSRKAFMFPERQMWPHGKWGDEVAYMDDLFEKPTEDGKKIYETAAYVVGKINGDHWCLYMVTPTDRVADPDDDEEEEEDEEDDVTLEVLMTGLDPEVMKLFWREGHLDVLKKEHGADEDDDEGKLNKLIANRVSTLSGISSIYPTSTIDDYMFDPCGYSMNGLLSPSAPYYYTIHITPEDF
ncbi:spermidine resistance protein, partial [Quaeritorhiza haematococci]